MLKPVTRALMSLRAIRKESQTFPEGKGVETTPRVSHHYFRSSRRPSQKVKVLKLVEQLSEKYGLHPGSQTFPEGKGVETNTGSAVLGAPTVSQTFPEGKGVETTLGLDTTTPQSSRRPSQKVKVLKLFQLGCSSQVIQGRRPSQKVKVLKLFKFCNEPIQEVVADLPRR